MDNDTNKEHRSYMNHNKARFGAELGCLVVFTLVCFSCYCSIKSKANAAPVENNRCVRRNPDTSFYFRGDDLFLDCSRE